MTEYKTLTQIPMGSLKKFIEENFENIYFSEKAETFFQNEFLGDIANLEDLISLKSGSPEEVSKWLADNYGLKLDAKGDYVIASVLFFALNFVKKATAEIIEGVDNKFKGGLHKKCVGFQNDDDKYLIELNVEDKRFNVFVSEHSFDNNIFNDINLFETYFKPKKDVNLTLPLVNFEEKMDLTDTFKGSSMVKKDDKEYYEITDAKSITLLNLGLDKVEVKQASVMSLTRGISFTLDMVINDDFFIYIVYNNKLAFASKMLKEDFLKA